ncbi:MAG: hypothetical protein PF448_11130 [Bacteroidales bacterium]|jgi:hypothetical protein|nr:hypothetical protein [Bacteroidales bacterium]
MKRILLISFVALFIFSCTKDDGTSFSSESDTYSTTDGSSTEGELIDPNGGDGQSGLITAGEWNDLDNWDFWKNLLNSQDYSELPDHWSIYTDHRISVTLSNESGEILRDKSLKLFRNGTKQWESKTDNLGMAELWYSSYQNGTETINDLTIQIEDYESTYSVEMYENGMNEIHVNIPNSTSQRVELAFIVDATGSMSDELEFLKDDLQDVIQAVESQNSAADIYTGTVFYRDEGDEYLTRFSQFNGNIHNTISFIDQQSAGGGGDYPEAVHTALNTGLTELQWSEDALSRIAFLILDAPPHNTQDVINDLQNSIKLYAEKGIKIIPIAASGIDTDTEYLLRAFSMLTNGTYVFITDDSGIGNEHLDPSVGDYEVELLNELMVRLILKYTEI